MTMHGLFPEDSAARKAIPIFSGLLQYFPSALAAVAHHSHIGNQKHNAGMPLHHDRTKSDDEADALCRHLMEADYVGVAWRSLSLLQKWCEANGAPVAPAARNARPAVAPEQSGYAPPALKWTTIDACQITGETEPLPTSAQWPPQNNRFVL